MAAAAQLDFEGLRNLCSTPDCVSLRRPMSSWNEAVYPSGWLNGPKDYKQDRFGLKW